MKIPTIVVLVTLGELGGFYINICVALTKVAKVSKSRHDSAELLGTHQQSSPMYEVG